MIEAPPQPATPDLALQLSGVGKAFDGVPALQDVGLTVERGRVRALVGGNGSGKSTLIKILAGVYTSDTGMITVNGRAFTSGELTPAAASDAGLRFVHQDLALLQDFSVAENLALAVGYPVGRGRIDWRLLRRTTREVLDRFEVDANPDDLIADLRPATRTMVAIARAMRGDEDGRGILVLDEPTASLPDHEVSQLMEAIQRRAAKGATIVYVSHRLTEVMTLADDVTVLRDGRHLTTLSRGEFDQQKLVELIAGRPISFARSPRGDHHRLAAPVVTTSDLFAGAIRGVDLSVHPGEIVGVAGLLGSGKTSLLRAIYGDLPVSAGSAEVAGSPSSSVGAGRIRSLVAGGVGMVPENRESDAGFPDLSVRENLSVSVLHQYAAKLGIRNRREHRDARSLVSRFSIRLHTVEQPFASLSGGNQQKVVIARWLRRKPKLLLLDEPTQGVDVGARSEIYDLLHAAAADGAGLLVASSDVEELCQLSDRVVVLREGRVVAALDAEQLDPAHILSLAYHDPHGETSQREQPGRTE